MGSRDEPLRDVDFNNGPINSTPRISGVEGKRDTIARQAHEEEATMCEQDDENESFDESAQIPAQDEDENDEDYHENEDPEDNPKAAMRSKSVWSGHCIAAKS